VVKKTHISGIFRKTFQNTLQKDETPRYPAVQPQLSSSSRGQPVFDINLCIGCGLCSKSCPSKAISIVTFEGKKHPQFHLDKCLFCYQCAESCPKKAISTSAYYELATTDKSALVVDPQICTYSIAIEIDKKQPAASDFGFYEKKASSER
jgi:formate hydrogenlyase subunit 6/NADH:ubiquinone oxidoreductase subunit I